MKNLVGIAVLLAFFVGCANPKQSAYRVVGTTANTVDSAMKGWGDYVKAGYAKAEEEVKVKAAYEKYQKSMLVAKAFINSYIDNEANENKLRVMVDAISSSSSELVSLINSFIQTK